MTSGRFALTTVALAAGCLVGSSAWALGLGRLTVQSALGETLRAEIDVTSLTAEEAASLALRVATPEAYRAAGVEYNAALAGAQVSLQRRADGRPFLRVASERPLIEPFVDVIVEATWATGRLVREYTLLLDPPTRVAAPPPAPSPAVASPAPTPAPAPAPTAAAPAAPVVAATAPARPRAPASAPAGRPAAAVDEYRVRSGDTLSRIAARNAQPGVSLDQMLVALFRGNPQAFMADNMNRLKAGAVLTVPAADAARRVTGAQAREVIQAQSADFAAYRQRLAGGVTTRADAGPARQSGGAVQARVDDRKQSTAASPDKLTLSQGAVKPGAPEAKISREAERKDTSTRVAELSRNVEELKRLQQGTAAPAASASPATPATAAAPPATTPAAAPAAAVSPAPAAPAAPAASAPAPALPAPAIVASMPSPTPPAASAVAATPVAPMDAEEPGFIDSLLESPWMLPAAGGLLALLVGLGLYRARSSRKKSGGETSFLESRLQPDSFFGASGGQRIDTREAGGGSSSSTSSSMSYSLSQLDAIGDVDPVAEADVYLAYGRDLQAEEILKEAMRATPQRMAIRTKLLEVYAKRRDTKGFELLASQVHALTRGEGDDWASVQEMGRQIDPDNPLYQPGGQPEPVAGAGGVPVMEPLGATTQPHTAKPAAPVFTPDSGFDSQPGALDLDLDIGGEAPVSPMEMTRPLPASADISLEPTLGFEAVPMVDEPSTQPAAMLSAPPAAAHGGLDFDLDSLSLDEQAPKTMPLPRADIGSQGLDFGDFQIAPPEPTTIAMGRPDAAVAATEEGAVDVPIDEDGDPLARKLELAEEFRQIGDVEGARDLLEEVIAKADGVLKVKAQAMLEGLA
ncbi:MAG: LysM peptidoglycan-binding domain-containing protein [Rubrivivax sp.]|nr:LysM peptidoglycan-binding domain-containing protein [Rubrivivax sp.]